MKFFFVALWSRQTEAVIGEAVRLNQLKEAIEAASAKFSSVNSADKFDGAIKWIFIGPEYLFTTDRQEGDDTTRALEPGKVSEITKELVKLSTAHKGMLLIPGSVIYQHGVAAQIGGSNEVVESVTKYEKSLDPTAVKGMPQSLRKQLLKPFDESSSPEAKLKKLTETPQDITHVVKNRVYVLLNGNVVARYGKKADKHEVMGPKSALFIPGQDSGTATIEGVKFGIEICYDHQMGVLRAISNDTKVDIHIVVSAFVENKVSNMQLRPKGYFLHASSDPAYTAVFYKPGKTGLAEQVTKDNIDSRLADLKAEGAQVMDATPCAGGTLGCYALPYFAP